MVRLYVTIAYVKLCELKSSLRVDDASLAVLRLTLSALSDSLLGKLNAVFLSIRAPSIWQVTMYFKSSYLLKSGRTRRAACEQPYDRFMFYILLCMSILDSYTDFT